MIKVVVAGCFDVLHPGHFEFLKFARKQGDSLTVLLARDNNVEKIKGRKPFFNESERKAMLEGLKFVDEVVLGSSDYGDKYGSLLKIKPDVLVLGYDQTGEKGEITEFVKKSGREIEVVEFGKAVEPQKYKSSVARKRLDFC